jgi:hypothetical protein
MRTNIPPSRALLALAALIVLLPGLVRPAAAQEAHYWSEQFGNRSMLLGGAVIGSVFDLGAVFYNPGRLGLIENPAFVLSAKAYQWDRYTIEGQDRNGALKQSKFGGAPSLVAGTFKVPFLENDQFAYAFLTRQRSSSNFFTRVELEGDFFPSIPGRDLFEGKGQFDSELREEWIGLTWSRGLREGLSFGLSTFVTTTNRSQDLSADLRALGEFGDVATAVSRRAYSYDSYGALWKAGLAFERGNLGLGLTVTTPRISAFGSGSTEFEEVLAGVPDTTALGRVSRFETSFQSGLSSSLKSPWSVGLGLGWDLGNFTVHASSEWYGKVERYEILESAPFVGQSTGDTLQYRIMGEARSVLNFGLGLEYRWSNTFSAFGSVATDNSSAPVADKEISVGDLEIDDKAFSGDFLILAGGVDMKTRWADLTLGATYAGSSQDVARFLDFPDEEDPGVTPEEGESSRFKYSKWRFLLGFSIPFAAEIAGRVSGGEEPPPEGSGR